MRHVSYQRLSAANLLFDVAFVWHPLTLVTRIYANDPCNRAVVLHPLLFLLTTRSSASTRSSYTTRNIGKHTLATAADLPTSPRSPDVSRIAWAI